MMRSTLGAPLGGTTRAGHQGFDPLVLRSIFPPNFCGGGGNCFPSIVVVADGEPGTPVVPWARVEGPGATRRVHADRTATRRPSVASISIRPILMTPPRSCEDASPTTQPPLRRRHGAINAFCASARRPGAIPYAPEGLWA